MYSFFEWQTHVGVINNLFYIYSAFNRWTHKPMSAVWLRYISNSGISTSPAKIVTCKVKAGHNVVRGTLAGLALPNCDSYHRWHNTMVEWEVAEIMKGVGEAKKIKNHPTWRHSHKLRPPGWTKGLDNMEWWRMDEKQKLGGGVINPRWIRVLDCWKGCEVGEESKLSKKWRPRRVMHREKELGWLVTFVWLWECPRDAWK